MRWMTSPARCPSATMASNTSRTCSRSGSAAASQLRHALASATIAASGWLVSCAIDAASSPSVVTRLTCASSACVLCSASSARLRSVMDVTERKRAEEALHRTQAELAHVSRVTTLGELAASIAHETNQPLAAIVADANACRNWLAAADPDLEQVRDVLDAIVAEGHRAGDVIQRIRQLATKTDPCRTPLDLNDVIRCVVPLILAEVRHHQVSLRLELAPALPSVLGDRVQVQQVIINLVINGIEAMTAVTDRTRELVIRSRPHDGNQVFVTVEDAGVGIDAANVDQLFDAFFTTKPGGMGMGLSISRSIIESHGGRLWATPNPTHGAIFHFALPVDADGTRPR